MKPLFLLLNLLLAAAYCSGQAQAPSTDQNYIYTKTCLNGDCTRKAAQVQYFDEMGRVKQVVDIAATPSGKDLVTHIPYDGFGRVAREYFPIPQEDTRNGAFYPDPLGHAPAVFGNERIYSEKEFELSPIGRVKKITTPGNEWSGQAATLAYAANAPEEVKKFTAAVSWQENATHHSIAQAGTYAARTLMKNTVTDAGGHTVTEFSNTAGQVLLARKNDGVQNLDTYYLYDIYGQLAAVIPPAAEKVPLTQNVLDSLCYQYRYDGMGRLVEKKLPGKGAEYRVYDKADRLILSQDAVMKAKNTWMMTKYDRYGRVAYTGLITGGSRDAMQTAAGSLTVTESRNTTGFTANGITVYYSNGHFADALQSVLSVNYYDAYPQGTPARPAQVLGQNTIPDDMAAPVTTRNLPVASYVKNLEDDKWTVSYLWYDGKTRPVGTHSVNHLGGSTRTESELDFAGMVKQTRTYHKRLNTDPEKTISQVFEYDAQNRLKKHWHQVDSGPQELLSENTYNERSQLSGKKTGNSLQDISYAYDIRGALTAVNNPGSPGSSLFGYAVSYYNPADVSEGSYSGNIASVTWKTATDGVKRRYSYRYDGLNRLTKGLYSEPENTVPQDDFYNEAVTYDLGGNIKTLKRNGKNALGMTAGIDDLTYTYAGNRLLSVKDDSQDYAGYPDVSGGTIGYDDNGNMTDHTDKGILEIRYNLLNQPHYIRFNESVGRIIRRYVNTAYTYRADGVKLRKVHSYKAHPTAASLSRTETDYLDGFQYETASYSAPGSAVLKFVPTAEGYYDFEKNKYIYSYTDHLGNIRLSYYRGADGSAEVLEENNYYPFGLKHEGYNTQPGNPSYTYQYNSKELQRETGWNDYGARMYMSDIGRWGVMDPLAETTTRVSPYNYALNNPVMMIDPDGRKAMSPYGPPGEGQDPRSAWFATRDSVLELMDKLVPEGAKGSVNPSTFGQTAAFRAIMAGLDQKPDPSPSVWKQIGNFLSNLFGGRKSTATGHQVHFSIVDIALIPEGAVGGSLSTSLQGIGTGLFSTAGLTAGAIFVPTMIGEPAFDWTRQFDATIDVPISGEISRVNNNRNGIMLYRGVSSFTHTQTQAIMYNEALFGIAIPNGLRPGETAHWDMDAHAMGDNYSVFTSWTSNPKQAFNFATNYGTESGVILSKRFKIGVNAIPNVSINGRLMQEGEWLIFGPVIRANVQHVKP